jgi:hypothetical protein
MKMNAQYSTVHECMEVFPIERRTIRKEIKKRIRNLPRSMNVNIFALKGAIFVFYIFLLRSFDSGCSAVSPFCQSAAQIEYTGHIHCPGDTTPSLPTNQQQQQAAARDDT